MQYSKISWVANADTVQNIGYPEVERIVQFTKALDLLIINVDSDNFVVTENSRFHHWPYCQWWTYLPCSFAVAARYP